MEAGSALDFSCKCFSYLALGYRGLRQVLLSESSLVQLWNISFVAILAVRAVQWGLFFQLLKAVFMDKTNEKLDFL